MAADESSNNLSMVYTLTPEASFSPSIAKAKYIYKIGSLLSDTETRQLEYKLGGYALQNLEEHIRKYGSAFLNANGGTLTMGVSDDGVVVGVAVTSSGKDRIAKQIEEEFRTFHPSVTKDLYEIDFVPTDQSDRYVIELHVRAGAEDEIYVGKNNKMYIKRDGSVQGPLWPRNIKTIVIEKYLKSLQSGASSSKSDLTKLADATPVLDSNTSHN